MLAEKYLCNFTTEMVKPLENSTSGSKKYGLWVYIVVITLVKSFIDYNYFCNLYIGSRKENLQLHLRMYFELIPLSKHAV